MKLNIPPLALCVVCAVMMYFVSRYTWSLEGFELGRSIVALIGLSIAFVFVVLGASLFKKKKTTVNPLSPDNSTYLVTSGIYTISRNPMYVGFSLSLISFAVYLGSIASLSFVVCFVAYMHYVQIPNEERALSKLFGEQYSQYKRVVRRWV